MPARIPKIIKGFNLFINGTTFAGICDEVTPPELTTKDEDHRGGGMFAPVSIEMGLEGLEMNAKFAEHSPGIATTFGLFNGNGVAITLRAAASDDATVAPIVIQATGRCSKQAFGTLKEGDKTLMELTFKLRYYRLEWDGKEQIEVDILRGVWRIDGVDQYLTRRNALLT